MEVIDHPRAPSRGVISNALVSEDRDKWIGKRLD